ncbi:MAG TPA: FKBP-type peptidyl-prolyl cis-trans isomerase [Bacteroidales bacterium]
MTRFLTYYLRFFILCGIPVSILFISCNSRNNEESKKNEPNREETLLRINKYLVGKDTDIIRGYLRRRNWQMETSPTGLWYAIYQKGTGPKAITGKMATLNYKVWLLDGTLCYSSDSLGQKKFRIGKGGVEKGLEEGVLMLHVGDKARFIMPPHLAEGLMGDGDKIPPRSIILYDVELVQISD